MSEVDEIFKRYLDVFSVKDAIIFQRKSGFEIAIPYTDNYYLSQSDFEELYFIPKQTISQYSLFSKNDLVKEFNTKDLEHLLFSLSCSLNSLSEVPRINELSLSYAESLPGVQSFIFVMPQQIDNLGKLCGEYLALNYFWENHNISSELKYEKNKPLFENIHSLFNSEKCNREIFYGLDEVLKFLNSTGFKKEVITKARKSFSEIIKSISNGEYSSQNSKNAKVVKLFS
jgi:hypothetical protein